MSATITVEIAGIKPKDEKFEQMERVYQACLAANVEVPQEVIEYFGRDEDDHVLVNEHGVLVPYLTRSVTGNWDSPKVNPHANWITRIDKVENYQIRKGFIVDINQTPKDIKLLQILACVS